MEIKGEVTDIIYKNEINSYMIAIFETKEEQITIVGYIPFINTGDSVKLIGEFIEHKEYGIQFKVETFEKLMPETLDALERYLASGNIKGIGEAIAKRIIQKFGEETINIFKNEYIKLSQIKGISKKGAKEMSDSFIENWEVWQIVGFLEKFGIGAEHAKKVFDKFGINAIQEIEINPYLLIEIARGVDFNQIDKMALNLGIEYNNEKRIQSGIKYGIIKATYNGNCCVLKENLIEFVISLLDVTTEEIENNIIDLIMTDEIIIEKRNKEEWVFLYNFNIAEETIAKRILKLDTNNNTKNIENIEKELEELEKSSNISLSKKQKEAIKAINKNNVTIITGGPGTGKTTIIKTIIDIYNKKENKIILTAPTGRAAKKMTETTGYEASTLHRLLEIGRIDEENNYTKKGEYKGVPIDADIIVVDELSMVDIFLMSYLLGSIYQGTKLILVGDGDQLSSVGPGSVLKDLIESKKIKTIKLDTIFRQAAKSKIVLNAHNVNKGQEFLNKEEINEMEEMKEDFFYIKKLNQENMLNELISLCTGRLKKYGDYDFFKNIQVMTPTKKGIIGTKELNKLLQEKLNIKTNKKQEKKRADIIYRTSDRIMQIKNNYDINWEKSQKETGRGIFNGETGTIIEINEKRIQVKFDDEKIAWYENSELDQIEHSYAITIHKAQGSEFDVVIMMLPQSAPMLLTRNLLYTGITRAKKLLIIIGSDKVIKYMIQNVDSKKRNTGLEYKIKEMQN